MEIAAIIPARFGSSRFPGKPLADIGGKTMIQRVYEQTRSAFEHVYVATDDLRIFNVVNSFGGKAVMTSDKHQSGTDRCREAIETIERESGNAFDIVVNVQGDEPFIDPLQLKTLVSCFKSEDTQIATLVKRFEPGEDIHNENTPKVIVSSRMEALYFSRAAIPFRRDIPKEEWAKDVVYYKHIGLYAYRRDILPTISSLPQSTLELCEKLEQLRWLENGFRVKVAETDIKTYAIDTPNDLEMLAAMGLF